MSTATTPASSEIALSGLLVDAGLDAAVLLSPQAFTHTTGLRVPSHTLLPWRHAAVLVTPEGVQAVLAVDMEATTVAAALPDLPLYVWKEFGGDAMSTLARMVTEQLGRGPLRIGWETTFVPVGAAERLRSLLPTVEWDACEHLVTRARLAKTPQERDQVVELVEASDNALADTIRDARVGDTEFDLAGRMLGNLHAQGIQEHACLIVATGERSQYPNVGPSERAIGAGDIVRLEIFGGRGGYRAGVARTAVVGAPTAEAARLWAVLAEAREAGMAAIAPGADPAAVYRAYVDALGPLREYAIGFFGHGMGLDLHELPYLSGTSTDPLVEGAVLGIEPFTMIPGRFGLQVKDVVTLTGAGAEVLSRRLDGGTLHVIDG
ncbi:Xaa-Pro peptidase family protein [Pseudonocardia xishanensis]|uniref:Aminopeptidase P family protein n=1 Tax=Pseudonocardia xishanensis TaxID=630995 RepID=A0ABP8RDP2_9PSEU